jgi:hypothetical protein
VQEEAEQAACNRPAVDHGIAAPGGPVGHDRPAGHHRDRQIAIDALVGGQLGIRQGGESAPPLCRPRLPPLECLGREIVESVVVLDQPETTRVDRRFLVLLAQELIDPLLEFGHPNTPFNTLLHPATRICIERRHRLFVALRSLDR